MSVGRLAVVILAVSVAAGGWWLGRQDRPASEVAPITLTQDGSDGMRREDETPEVESVPDDDDPTDDPPTGDRRGADASREGVDADAAATEDDAQPARRRAATDDGAEANQEAANSAPAGPAAADDTNDQASDGDGTDSGSDNT